MTGPAVVVIDEGDAPLEDDTPATYAFEVLDELRAAIARWHDDEHDEPARFCAHPVCATLDGRSPL